MMRKIVLLIVLMFYPVWVNADTTGATFLKISPGAKPVGMGGAYTSVSGDINCLYYNPAGIASIDRPQLGAMHTQWISDIKYNYAAGAFKFKKGVMGVSATLLTMGELEGRGADREETGTFRAYDAAVQFSYAKRISKSKLIGSSIKIIREQIEEESASSVGIDIGIQSEIAGNIDIGIALRNMGPKIKFINEGYNLPVSIGAGCGLRIGGVRLGIDTNYEIIEENIRLSFGTEYVPVRFISLRGGYFMNLIDKTILADKYKVKEKGQGLGGGVGINILKYSLNYAVVPYIDLGTTHRISFLVKF
ncbi:PorV/PorQ family protein [Elusimicrobiota bacterium]